MTGSGEEENAAEEEEKEEEEEEGGEEEEEEGRRRGRKGYQYWYDTTIENHKGNQFLYVWW